MLFEVNLAMNSVYIMFCFVSLFFNGHFHRSHRRIMQQHTSTSSDDEVQVLDGLDAVRESAPFKSAF